MYHVAVADFWAHTGHRIGMTEAKLTLLQVSVASKLFDVILRTVVTSVHNLL